jgi:uncharacterized protein (DUF488 family)
VIFTVGHSNHPIERFVELLTRQAIATVADVRSTPFSRFNPQFNRESLAATLEAAGIRYVFLGEELGARSRDPACYEDDRVSYAKLAASESFKRGLSRAVAESEDGRLALMCAEREPLDCHRTILVARELEQIDVPVTHILADGSLEPHERTIRRLIAAEKVETDDLFRTPAQIAAAAYDARAKKIAYLRSEGTRR